MIISWRQAVCDRERECQEKRSCKCLKADLKESEEKAFREQRNTIELRSVLSDLAELGPDEVESLSKSLWRGRFERRKQKREDRRAYLAGWVRAQGEDYGAQIGGLPWVKRILKSVSRGRSTRQMIDDADGGDKTPLVELEKMFPPGTIRWIKKPGHRDLPEDPMLIAHLEWFRLFVRNNDFDNALVAIRHLYFRCKAFSKTGGKS